MGLAVAGLVSPIVGDAIDLVGGRVVLATSSVLLAGGLCWLAHAKSPITYLTAWATLGVGMGAGMYDAAFATLGTIYRAGARPVVSALTLVAGFASTVTWLVSTVILSHAGWRATCCTYAVLLLTVALPLHILCIPPSRSRLSKADRAECSSKRLLARTEVGVFATLVLVFSAVSAIASVMSVYLVILLMLGGLPTVSAVAISTLIGPTQVAARAIELRFGHRSHPLKTLVISTVLMLVGAVVLVSGSTFASIGVAFYGAGVGISSIVRGTVPLELFGAKRYPRIMGRLALPSLLGQAVAPPAAALIVAAGGRSAVLIALAALAAAAAGLSSMLLITVGQTKPEVHSPG